jgi:hypothetical protein
MGRQASEVLWLTLENEAGEVTRMGVTPTHPLFIAGTGWGDAGALVPGDAIRDKDLQALTVLAVEVDQSPQMVHNLEVADAHTYFAGELEAWGHNAGIGHNGGPPFDPFDYMREPGNLCEQLALDEIMNNPTMGTDTGISLGNPKIPPNYKKMRYTRRTSCGKKTIHYLYDQATGIAGDFKFKLR